MLRLESRITIYLSMMLDPLITVERNVLNEFVEFKCIKPLVESMDIDIYIKKALARTSPNMMNSIIMEITYASSQQP